MFRKMLFGCALATLVSLSAASSASAQGPVDQTTFFTFSAPFELPGGKTLPAGKYTFKIVDSPSNRHAVQIMSEDRQQIHATILAIPAQRQDPPSEPEVRFMETAANMPPAIRTWWYPGRTIGHEFIYPKDQARKLAARQKEPVLTVSTDASTNDTMQTADLSRINATGQENVWTATPSAQTTAAEVTRAPQSAPTTAAPAMREQTPMASSMETTRTAETRPARRSLPRTAGVLPLAALLGFASLAGAAALRLRRQ